MDLQLADKTVLITGAAGGVGLATVRAFLDEGARVVAADMAPSMPDSLAALAPAGDRLCYLGGDLREARDIARIVSGAGAFAGGPVEVCVNNAGITHRAEFLDMDVADFDRVLAVNLRAPFLLGQAVARALADAGRPGAIVNIGSVNAQVALPDNAAYVASKGGLLQLTRAMALALAPHGIRVNMVAPGSIDTPLQRSGQSRSPELRRRVLSRTPLGRLGRPEEVADAILYMASPRSSYVTGECLFVDGGRLPLNFTVPVPVPEDDGSGG
ncbi:MAG: SDR family NAD(P)-dependent oxidoreductase [Paracoccaceae bacterium]